MHKIFYIGSALFTMALAVVPLAAAEDNSSLAGYGGVAGAVNTQVTAQSPAPPKTVESLPFTGQDLALMLAVGLLLLALGFGLRRVARNKA